MKNQCCPFCGSPASAAELGDLKLGPDGRMYLLGKRLNLGAQAASILELLREARGGPVKPGEILERCWGGTSPRPGRNIVSVHMSAIRTALAGTRWRIRSVYGEGYALERKPD